MFCGIIFRCRDLENKLTRVRTIQSYPQLTKKEIYATLGQVIAEEGRHSRSEMRNIFETDRRALVIPLPAHGLLDFIFLASEPHSRYRLHRLLLAP
ncbi:MAG: hypothetical protein A3D57_04930 [Candidatus Sungbacteria bacterium RIFCSPHIGHO2_02_FULL_46_12]|nr:MAG: hypothetical protein A3D57_04930 [Candidatus Sungbacteria bacterium RIFCSPHIGHO2_02_FULL_46_12]